MVVDHWSIRRNTRFHRKAYRAINTAGVLSRTVIVKNIPNSLTYPIASSFVCNSPLAVMTIVGLHDFLQNIHFSITQVLFADHVHWRSRVDNKFSFLRFKSWCRQAPFLRRWEECCSFDAPWILTHFWPASTLLRGHLALATLSPLETDPQVLERWGCADDFHMDKYIRPKDFGLEF